MSSLTLCLFSGYGFGPSASAIQQLAAWFFIGVHLFLQEPKSTAKPVWAWLTLVCLLLLAFSGHETSVWLPPTLALAFVGAAALLGANSTSSVQRTNGQDSRKWVAVGLLLAACLSATAGLLQYHGLAAALRPWVAVPLEPIGMAYGNLRQRNQFATLLSMGLVALLWAHGRAGARGRRGLLAAGALLIAGLAASTSRTGLLQLGVIATGAGWMAWRERRPVEPGSAVPGGNLMRPLLPHPGWFLGALALYALLSWALPWSAVMVASFLAGGGSAGADVQGMLTRLREGAPPGHSRWLLWHNVLWLIAQRPWTGWGWGQLSLAHYLAEYPGPRFVEILDNAHNLPLHLAVELG
ncbi:O-antigen ligase family protein, partial [Pseudacidovorax intermedius]|uniref:O-antigen ligase family protein n=1 Tax=Pseudacidovorax intermedius TaxID=433924 RepID=UPI001E34EB97